MTIPDILAALEYNTGVFPKKAIEEAIVQREAITPELLRILEEDAANLAEVVSREDYMAHLYAMYLLAQFRERRAYPLLVNFFSGDRELVDVATGDVITEDLNRMLASVCGGDTSLIEHMIEDTALDEYVRNAAVGALVVLVAQGVKSRDEVIAYFRKLFHGKLEREESYVWSGLIVASCRLYPGELMAEIEQAFAAGLVDPFVMRIEYVRKRLAAGKEAVLADLATNRRMRFIEDTIQEMESWACFEVPSKPRAKPQTVVTPAPAPKRAAPKVGRNDPCPCGSGKKYKKCCLR